MNAFWSALHYHEYFVTFKVYTEQEGVYLTWTPQYLCGSLRLEDWIFSTRTCFTANLSPPSQLRQLGFSPPASCCGLEVISVYQLITILLHIYLLFYSCEITLKTVSHFKFTETCEGQVQEKQIWFFPFVR